MPSLRASLFLLSTAAYLALGAYELSPDSHDVVTSPTGGRRGLRSKISKLIGKVSKEEKLRQRGESGEKHTGGTVETPTVQRVEQKDDRAAQMEEAKTEAVALASEEVARADAAEKAVADARDERRKRRQERVQGRRVERRVAGRRAELEAKASEARLAANEATAAVKAAQWEREGNDWTTYKAAASGSGTSSGAASGLDSAVAEPLTTLAQPFYFPEVGTWVKVVNVKSALNGQMGIVATLDAVTWTVNVQLSGGAGVLKKVKLNALRYFPPIGTDVMLQTCAGDVCKVGVRLQSSLVGQKGVLEAVDLESWSASVRLDAVREVSDYNIGAVISGAGATERGAGKLLRRVQLGSLATLPPRLAHVRRVHFPSSSQLSASSMNGDSSSGVGGPASERHEALEQTHGVVLSVNRAKWTVVVRYDGAIQPVEEQPSSLELDFANDKLRRLRRAFMAQKQAQEMQAQLSDFTPGTTARDGLASSTSSSLAYGSMGGAGAGDQQVAWAGAAVAIAHAAAEHVSAAAAHVAAVAAEPEGQQPGAVLALEDALRAALDKVEGLRARAGAPTATADASAVAVDSSEGASNSI